MTDYAAVVADLARLGIVVAGRLNAIATALILAHEEFAALLHDLRVAESFADIRPSFPIRCMGRDEWEA